MRSKFGRFPKGQIALGYCSNDPEQSHPGIPSGRPDTLGHSHMRPALIEQKLSTLCPGRQAPAF